MSGLDPDHLTIAFIGLGEAASAIITGLGPDRAQQIQSYDIKHDAPGPRDEIRDRAKALAVKTCATSHEAVQTAELIFSTVTADQAFAAAEAAAPHIQRGAIWCDLNSCAPATKRRACEVIQGAGGIYLDVAVMTPIHPRLNLSPMLTSGPKAQTITPLLAALPLNVRTVGDKIGQASSIKMIRSIMVKGLEALTAECALAAFSAGVEDEVFASLDAANPPATIAERAHYNFERSLTHGLRRSAEMEEVARMLTDLGLPNDMATATTDWQKRLGQLELRETDAFSDEALAKVVRRVLERFNRR